MKLQSCKTLWVGAQHSSERHHPHKKNADCPQQQHPATPWEIHIHIVILVISKGLGWILIIWLRVPLVLQQNCFGFKLALQWSLGYCMHYIPEPYGIHTLRANMDWSFYVCLYLLGQLWVWLLHTQAVCLSLKFQEPSLPCTYAQWPAQTLATPLTCNNTFSANNLSTYSNSWRLIIHFLYMANSDTKTTRWSDTETTTFVYYLSEHCSERAGEGIQEGHLGSSCCPY